MAKQLIVVVHGVGINQAGITSNMMAATLGNSIETPTSTENFSLVEHGRHNDKDLNRSFPCHLQRYKKGANERVFADFYWGDISHVGAGLVGLIYAIITLILGLSHPIRENASDVYKDHPGLNRMVHTMVKLIHGPIVAINLVLLGGIFVAWGIGWFPAFEASGWYSAIIAGLLAIGAGEFLRRRENSYLSRLLASWIMITGATMIILQIASMIPGLDELFIRISQELRIIMCSGANGSACIDKLTGIYLIGAFLLVAMGLCWFVLFILLGILAVMNIVYKSDLPDTTNIIMPSVMLMSVL